MSSAKKELNNLQSKSTKITAQSVSKTKEMLQLVNECKDAGVNTLRDLYSQGDQLTRTEVTLNDISQQLDSAQITIENIEKTNRVPCCCIPCLSCWKKNPDRNQKKQSFSIGKDQLKRKKKESPTGVLTVLSPRRDVFSSNKDERFFPKVLGTKEEDEIERNLSHISEGLSTLKGVALNMNTETKKQNEQIDRMNTKTEISEVKVKKSTKATSDLVKENSRSSCCCWSM